MTCEGGCGKEMSHPHMLDADERALCAECSACICALGCGKVCPPFDRLPFTNGGKPGHVHAMCGMRATRALGFELAATLLVRRGFKVSA